MTAIISETAVNSCIQASFYSRYNIASFKLVRPILSRSFLFLDSENIGCDLLRQTTCLQRNHRPSLHFPVTSYKLGGESDSLKVNFCFRYNLLISPVSLFWSLQ